MKSKQDNKTSTGLPTWAIRESHGRQFEGEDYQAVAWDMVNRPRGLEIDPKTEDGEAQWLELESGPEPDIDNPSQCGCEVCETLPPYREPGRGMEANSFGYRP
jgi:hypothetical protein